MTKINNIRWFLKENKKKTKTIKRISNKNPIIHPIVMAIKFKGSMIHNHLPIPLRNLILIKIEKLIKVTRNLQNQKKKSINNLPNHRQNHLHILLLDQDPEETRRVKKNTVKKRRKKVNNTLKKMKNMNIANIKKGGRTNHLLRRRDLSHNRPRILLPLILLKSRIIKRRTKRNDLITFSNSLFILLFMCICMHTHIF